MRLHLKTQVSQDYQKVWAQFDEKLFLALNPPLMPVKLVRFDGCQKGDEVHLQFPFGMKWVSQIVEQGSDEQQHYFIDEGIQLPFPLKYWHHEHRILKKESHCVIEDDITYTTAYKWLDILLYPILYVQFWYRKPIYRRYF